MKSEIEAEWVEALILDMQASMISPKSKIEINTSLPNSPPPNSYSLKTEFDDSKDKKRGFCFGGGRG